MIAESSADRAEIRDNWDVVVVGAGPAGALAAYLLARSSLKTLLVDKERFPRHKVCGGCLNATSLSILQVVGLGGICNELAAPRTSAIRLACGGRMVRMITPLGRALSRRVLDAALVAAAERAGAVFHDGTSATVLAAADNDVSRRVRLHRGSHRPHTVAAKVVVAADGLGHPSLSRLADFDVSIAKHSRIGLGTILNLPGGTTCDDSITMAIGEHGYVGAVVVEDGQLNVAAAVDANALRKLGPSGTVESILSDAGVVIDGLHACEWRGTRPLTCSSNRVADWRLFVIGDAVGYVEPFTGEGISWALSFAVDVVPLVQRACTEWHDSDIDAWQIGRSRATKAQRICRGIQPVLRRPRLSRCLVTLLRWCPQLATPIVQRLARPMTAIETSEHGNAECNAAKHEVTT